MDTHKKQHRVAVVYSDSGETQEFTVKNAVTGSCLSVPSPLTKWWWRSHENRPDSFGRFFMSMKIAKLDRQLKRNYFSSPSLRSQIEAG